MNNNCMCGGKFRNIDHAKEIQYEGRTIFETIRVKPGYASWRCNKCKKLQEQKLRIGGAR